MALLPAGAPAGVAAGARRPLPSLAAATSRAITRPCGPEPAMRPISMPASLASRRASGEEKARFVPLPLVRTPSPPPSARRGEGGGGAGGSVGDFTSLADGEVLSAGDAACGAAPSPRGGEGGGEGARALGTGPFPAPAAAAFASS